MRSPEEKSAAGTVEQQGAIARSIVFSVLISVGAVLFKVWWGKPAAIVTLLLALFLAFVGGVALIRMLAEDKQRTLATLWQSLVLSAVGLLLLILVGRNDWLVMLPGIVIAGIGLGSASQTTAALLQPLANISVGTGAALLASIATTLVGILLIQSYASPDFAIALLIDLVLLGALAARIAECDVA